MATMNEEAVKAAPKTCFVIMPISDGNGYPDGHFARVYQHVIKPACLSAGFTPIRADEVKAANYIVLDVLHRIINSDIVVCDLSGRNPNVLYELGIRQAFDLPVVLLKDKSTDRIFDIQGIRTVEYDETLRVDTVLRDVEGIVSAITSTSSPSTHDVNSLVKLLGVTKASLSTHTEISSETALVLETLRDITERLGRLEKRAPKPVTVTTKLRRPFQGTEVQLPSGEKVDEGDSLYIDAKEVGRFAGVGPDGGVVLELGKGHYLSIPPDHENFLKLTGIPF